MRKLLYIIFVPLLLTEWFLDMIVKIFSVIHKSVEDMTLATHKFIINEPDSKKPSDEGG